MAPGKSLLFVASGFVIVNHGLFDVEWVNMGGNGKIWGLTHWGRVTNIWVSNLGYHYTPRFNEVEKGVYWFHLVRLSVRPSVPPSVCLSVCGQNRVRSVSSTLLVGSISYLHILSSNFRRCVACNVCFKICKCKILANSLKFVYLTLSSFDLGSNMTQ